MAFGEDDVRYASGHTPTTPCDITLPPVSQWGVYLAGQRRRMAEALRQAASEQDPEKLMQLTRRVVELPDKRHVRLSTTAAFGPSSNRED